MQLAVLGKLPSKLMSDCQNRVRSSLCKIESHYPQPISIRSSIVIAAWRPISAIGSLKSTAIHGRLYPEAIKVRKIPAICLLSVFCNYACSSRFWRSR